MTILHRAWSKYCDDGLVPLFKVGVPIISNTFLNSVRAVTPPERYAIWNGVKVPPEVAPQYRTIDKYFTLVQTDYKQSEGGEVESHKEFTQSGDTVVIIGGGRGVTTVHAIQESSPNGHVIVYEASEKYSKIINEVIELNNVEGSWEIRNTLVGIDIKVYDDSVHHESIHPQELPECDVLEMDCEGAELNILENMDILPRVIIMEVHPQRYQRAPEAIEKLTDLGYDIMSWKTNEGENLTKSQFYKVLEKCSRGEAPAPVLVGVNQSENHK